MSISVCLKENGTDILDISGYKNQNVKIEKLPEIIKKLEN